MLVVQGTLQQVQLRCCSGTRYVAIGTGAVLLGHDAGTGYAAAGTAMMLQAHASGTRYVARGTGAVLLGHDAGSRRMLVVLVRGTFP